MTSPYPVLSDMKTAGRAKKDSHRGIFSRRCFVFFGNDHMLEREMNDVIADAYFAGWRDRNIDAIAVTLHPEVTFLGPLARFDGREAMLAAFAPLLPMLDSFELRHVQIAGDTGMAAYDFVCPAPVGRIRMAELITFRDGKIASSEMFFDPRPLIATQAAT